MTRLRLVTAAAGLALAAGCATAPQAPVTRSRAPTQTLPAAGLERVLGQDARTLEALFGRPDQDVREEGARRLQFAGPACVLDAYLYPREAGREPVVAWLDARLPNGEDFDRASCVAALSRRR